MSGTKQGGINAAKTNRLFYGEDFYKKIGSKGGSVKVPKGFAISGKASEAGKKGGAISKRGPAKDILGYELYDSKPLLWTQEEEEEFSPWYEKVKRWIK